VKVDSTSTFINTIFFPSINQVVVSSDGVPTDCLESSITFPNWGFGQDGFRISNDSGKTFGPKILKDYSIYSMLVYPTNPQLWLASMRQSNDGWISISTDGGQTWDLTNQKCLSSSQVVDFVVNQTNGIKILAADIGASKGFKFSSDTFNTCGVDDAFVIQARSIKVSPYDPNLIFIGGDKSQTSHIYRSYSAGKNDWVGEESGLEGKRVLCVMPSQWEKSVIYCGVDSVDINKISHGKGLYQSLDTGKTWKLIALQGKRVFSIAQHPKNKKFLAAACDSDGVWFSGSYGYGWEKISDGLPLGSFRVVAFPNWDYNSQGGICFAGSFGNGLFKSKRVITSIQNDETVSNDLELLTISPNPSSANVNIQFINNGQSFVNLKIYNELGSAVYYNTINSIENFNNIVWNGESYPSGIYYLIIQSGNSVIKEKIVLVK